MKILITNHWLKKLGGSETFTYTLAGELAKQGHKVELYTRVPGIVAKRICSNFYITRVTDPKARKYDLILANHNTCVHDVYPHQAPIIQTCHGTTPKLEQPAAFADKHVAISEEVKQHLSGMGIQSTVILNGVDCNRFRPIVPLNKTIKTVLSLSHSDELNNLLKSIFALKGIKVITLNKFKNPVWAVENYINRADMVISLGRGAYEALACGRPVLILDKRPYQQQMGDGLLTKTNAAKVLEHNCSGRAFKNTNINQMIDYAIANYNPALSGWYRILALQELNIERQVQKYLSL